MAAATDVGTGVDVGVGTPDVGIVRLGVVGVGAAGPTVVVVGVVGVGAAEPTGSASLALTSDGLRRRPEGGTIPLPIAPTATTPTSVAAAAASSQASTVPTVLARLDRPLSVGMRTSPACCFLVKARLWDCHGCASDWGRAAVWPTVGCRAPCAAR
ncbi:hypothetical protein GCM10023317_67490 [Actinopolymorpha pittospori]